MSRRTRPSEGAADDTTDDIVGVVRFARTGDASSKALRDGDIAVVDLPDLDRGQAEALVARNVRAVLNAAESSTGRFPNLGPQVLADAGVTLIDHVGAGIWSRLRSGDTVRIADGKVFKDEVLVAQGHMVDDATRSQRLGVAERDLATRLGSLTANASDHLERERELLLEGARIPRLATRLRGRPVVVVSRTYGWQDDLKRIRRWIRDSGAVVVGVTAGADALLDAKITPDVVIGHLDDLSDRALRSGADVVVVTSSGRSEGHERFERAGVDVATFTASGAPSDLAILLADSNDAPVIVEVGAPRGLVEFLERGTAEVASSFVTRLRAASTLVDARAVAHFTRRTMPAWPVLLVLVAGVLAVVAAIGVTPTGRDWYDALGDSVGDLRTWLEGLL
ncbi:putative cytokinetic ring protein SteA [Aeromicrobium sp. 50.2.37]|uniref:putative cytokinetic ring protein SteA n=1 Tax=Aeromicrobium sp. 50.2.37 TaxID=2969305 RepID=UPI00214F9325|nr:putative cytokinetic ring protein SteA [Aeromicrobium sp. 50.2.37]MCR4514580.1 putative cytokinetic ring protein SteA [Aeromicrobium sp. 50.2.37]